MEWPRPSSTVGISIRVAQYPGARRPQRALNVPYRARRLTEPPRFMESPIGGITFYRDDNHASTLDDLVIGAVVAGDGKTRAQVMLLCRLQQGRSVIPKFTKPTRIAENIDVLDFKLSVGEMPVIDGLETGRRGGPEPKPTTLDPSVA
jgi:hypothetical protein